MTHSSNASQQRHPHGFQFESTYLTLPDAFYSCVTPTPVLSPKIAQLNTELASSIGVSFLTADECDVAALLSGNQVSHGTTPFAQAYAGHQFGHFTLLGDGRAHVLGEHQLPDGRRVDIQLKGSGQTPYSRRGDGRAALGPMLREYILSEAMHGLGIPTTRSLAVVSTGENVFRETPLQGAILTRVAMSHIRVGTFEYAAASQDKGLVEALLNYTVDRHMPDIKQDPNIAISFLNRVVQSQVDLLVNWMRVGFIHGVMNTDNMLISGETIDYGPCAFMDDYDPETVFSSIDHMGRYAYANQPMAAQWNLVRLAETLLPMLADTEDDAIKAAKTMIDGFSTSYQHQWLTMMREKLGLFGHQSDDKTLILDLLTIMHDHNADYTNTFRALSQSDNPTGPLHDTQAFGDWVKRWEERLKANKEDREASIALMKQRNPAVIPRNHLVENALDAAIQGDFSQVNGLLDVLKTPYSDGPDLGPFKQPPTPSERVQHTFCGT